MFRGGAASGGAGDVFIADLTAVENTGSTQTNVPLSFGIPLSASNTVNGSTTFKVVDQDTSSAILCQEDNRASDLAPVVRYASLSCILPSLTGNATKALKVYSTSGSPATGTDITTSDITGTSYDAAVSIVDSAATTYTASPLTALTSGNSGWVNLTTATVMGKFRQAGGLATEYILYVPLKTGGGTAHPTLRAYFDVVCYKAARSAVGGGNPITSCRTDVLFTNSWAQNASPADLLYSVSIGSGGACFSQSNSLKNTTFTLGGNGTVPSAAYVGITAGSAIFTTDDLGKTYSDGTGMFTVLRGVTGTPSTTAVVGVMKAFGGTSLSANTVTEYGIPHWYGSFWRQRCSWVPSGTAPNVDVTNGNLYLGTAWNGGTLTGGPGSYIAGTGLMLNYDVTPSGVTNVDPKTNSNPFEYIAPSQLGNGWIGGVANSDATYITFIGNTGETGHIGVTPIWEFNALFRYDSTAYKSIFHNADFALTLPLGWFNSSTGYLSVPNNGTGAGQGDWCTGGCSSGVSIAQTSTYLTPWNNSGDTGGKGTSVIDASHGPEPFFTSYIMTGDWVWLMGQIGVTNMYSFATNPGFAGSQLTRLIYDQQQRGMAWTFRTIANTALLLPDTDPGTLGWTKSTTKTWLSNHWTTTTNTAPLTNGTVINGPSNSNFENTCSTLPSSACGLHWYAGCCDAAVSLWQLGYTVFSFAHLAESGMCDSNCALTAKWISDSLTNIALNTNDANPAYWIQSYWTAVEAPPAGSSPVLYHLPDTYNAYAVDAGNNGGGGTFRTIAGTATMGGSCNTSTATCSITLPDKTSMAAGNSFYTAQGAGWFMAGGGACKISNVNNSGATTVLTCATNAGTTTYGMGQRTGATFAAGSYSGGSYTIPGPAPGDPVGTQGFSSSEYPQLQQQAAMYAQACSSVWGTNSTYAASALSAINAITGGTISPYPQWNTTARAGGGC